MSRPAVSLSLSVLVLLSGVAFAADEPPAVRLLYVGPAEGSEARGVARGLEEANHLGRFTGHRFAVEPAAPAGEPPVAVLAAVDAAAVEALAAAWAERGVAVLNLASRDDALRRRCQPNLLQLNLLHVTPSDGMLAAAEAQWRQTHPDGPEARASAWHPDFVKYAASDLNQRFRASQGVAMDDGAWAGWAAVKMVSETVARTGSNDPATVLAYLRQQLRFDGQKGTAHTFHPNGQLRQPLLLSVEGKLVGEAPVRGAAELEDLDSLGLVPCDGSEEGGER